MNIFILFTLLIAGVPLILCSDSIPQITRPEKNNMQNGGVDPIITAQVDEDFTVNKRILRLETKSKKQENKISSLTATVHEDKKLIYHLKGRLEQLESKYEFDSSGDKFHGGKIKHRREAESRPKEKEKCTESSKRCTFSYPDYPDAIVSARNIGLFGKSIRKYLNTSYEYQENVNRQPTNCKDLNLLGHTLEGFYLVKGIDESSGKNKMKTVYCTFMEENDLGNFIGNVEIKTKNAHFYVQRNTNFGAEGIIPFEIERLNVGGAMNIKTGHFTAPVNGIYHFEFSSLKAADTFAHCYVELVANGTPVGSSYVGEGSAHLPFSSLSASLRLKAGEKVWLRKDGVAPFMDFYSRFTHFTGWLVEESYAVLP